MSQWFPDYSPIPEISGWSLWKSVLSNGLDTVRQYDVRDLGVIGKGIVANGRHGVWNGISRILRSGILQKRCLIRVEEYAVIAGVGFAPFCDRDAFEIAASIEYATPQSRQAGRERNGR